jgi:hypothetical protein
MLFNTATSNTSLINGLSDRNLPDPFLTYSVMLMPRTIEALLRWAEQLWSRNSTYAQACRRVVRYFITDVILSSGSEDEKKRWTKYLKKSIHILRELESVGDDVACYGNALRSLYVPFNRTLRCKACRTERPLSALDYRFSGFKFEYKCPVCKTANVADKPIDRLSRDESKIEVIRWNPHEIKIIEHPISRLKEYFWVTPASEKAKISSGDRFTLETMPWEMIEAVRDGQFFKFGPRVMFHALETTVSGVRAGGWGITRQYTNFHQALYVQILKLANETLALEYTVPMRLISPKQGPVDPLRNGNMGEWKRELNNMLRSHIRKPGGYYQLPFPVDYQLLSGETNRYSSHELINQALDEMLNGAGIPVELYKGTLTTQAAPTSLRLFQQTWNSLIEGYDEFVQWVVDSTSLAMNWEAVDATMKRPTLADDIENKQLLLQMAAGNQMSKRVAYEPLGVDPDEDLETRLDEQRREAEKIEEFQREQENRKVMLQQMQPVAAQAAGVQAGTPDLSGGASVTPDDRMAQADQIAEQMLRMPDSQRRSELIKLKRTSETLWGLVKAKLQNKRQDITSQGRQAMMQQIQGQPAAA